MQIMVLLENVMVPSPRHNDESKRSRRYLLHPSCRVIKPHTGRCGSCCPKSLRAIRKSAHMDEIIQTTPAPRNAAVQAGSQKPTASN
jgi:hypothetical protein